MMRKRNQSSVLRILVLATGLSLMVGAPRANRHSGARTTGQAPAFLTPPTSELERVPLPGLDALEAGVRDQILKQQETVTRLLSQDLASSRPGLARAFGDLAGLYHAYQFRSAALACYRNARRLSADDFRWTYLLATLYRESGRLEEAIVAYREARRLEPRYRAATNYLGMVHLQLNQFEQAAKEFRSALDMNPSDAAALFGLGEVRMAQLRYEEAIELYEAALRQVPEANRIHYSLGMAYRGAGRLDRAREHLGKRGKVGVRPSDPIGEAIQKLALGERIHVARGKQAYEAGLFQEAADAFQRALAVNPTNTTALVNLGSSLERLGQAGLALECFQAVIALEPDNRTAHYNLAGLFFRKSDFLRASKHFQEAVRISPDDIEAHRFLGRSYQRLNQPDSAETAFTRAFDLDPSRERSLLDLVGLLVEQARYEEAIERLLLSNQRFPNRQATLFALVRLWVAGPHEFRDGKRALEPARRLYEDRKTVDNGRVLAQALAETGRCQEAARLQERLLAVAERASRQDLAAALKTELVHYSEKRPCRPPFGN